MSAADSLDPLLRSVAGSPEKMARVARILMVKGQLELAKELCTKAVQLAPNSGEVATIAREVFSNNVPDWFYPMVLDRDRNKKHESAMRRVIKQGDQVLEIGTGTGLFSMMAARAGAARVTTCETNPSIAEVAREIIALNGFSDRVHVIEKDVSEIEIGVDLDKPADVIICDVLSNNMIGAGVLPLIEQSVNRLARPGAPTIPASATIRVALAEFTKAHVRKMGIVEGLDLSPFNKLARSCYPLWGGADHFNLRSAPCDLFEFDFISGGPFPESRVTKTLNATGGYVNGIVQWNHFRLDDKDSYENLPSEGSYSVFDVIFHPLLRPLDLRPGDTVKICGAHNRHAPQIWVEDA